MLKVTVEGDDLVIRLSPDALKAATEMCPKLEHYCELHNDFEAPKVTDIAVWRKEVELVLNAEEEDGTTLVHRMFDEAFCQAVERGAEGILLPWCD